MSSLLQLILVMPTTDAISERSFSSLGMSRARGVSGFSHRGNIYGKKNIVYKAYHTDKEEITKQLARNVTCSLARNITYSKHVTASFFSFFSPFFPPLPSLEYSYLLSKNETFCNCV